jgi:RNA polymerase sigma-70 factor, ECF subfamily
LLFGSKEKRESFKKAALEHLDALYGTALRLTGQPADAEDLIHDCYVRAVRFCHRFDPNTNLRAWLYRMLFNLFVNKYRRNKRSREIQEGSERQDLLDRVLPEEHLAATNNPEEYFFEKMFSDDVVRALDSLPPDFKMVILLADVNDFSYLEIAGILGIPVGTVMSRLHRGRRILRGTLRQFALEEGYVKPSSECEEPTNIKDYRSKKLAGRGVDHELH